MKTSGKTVLITGGASGIGFELARRLRALGNEVLVTGRDEAKLARAREAIPGLRTYRSDVGDPAAIGALFAAVTKDFPALDVLVNNAGIMRKIDLREGAAGEADLTDLTREIETNLVGPMRMVKQFLPHLLARPEAAILNVSSGLAYVPLAASPVYCAAKAGLHSYTESLRAQLKRTHVKVFELAAPVTETPMLDAFEASEMKGAAIMTAEAMVAVVLEAMRRDRFEIRPGGASTLRFLSRFAPGFVFGQLNKSVDGMLAKAPPAALTASG